jgi:hypothetical protein
LWKATHAGKVLEMTRSHSCINSGVSLCIHIWLAGLLRDKQPISNPQQLSSSQSPTTPRRYGLAHAWHRRLLVARSSASRGLAAEKQNATGQVFGGFRLLRAKGQRKSGSGGKVRTEQEGRNEWAGLGNERPGGEKWSLSSPPKATLENGGSR